MSVAGMNVDSGQKTWLTPPEIIRSLGEFDLDPCVPDSMPWQTAKRMVTKAEDGLTVDWNGKRVWLNPPYGRERATRSSVRWRSILVAGLRSCSGERILGPGRTSYFRMHIRCFL